MKLPYPATSDHHRFKFFSPFLTFFHPTIIAPSSTNQIHTKPSKISASTSTISTRRSKRKIVVIMGPTGAGKSRLSIDLATRFFENAEIINSDKMQVYSGLDITTNKITMREQMGVPHHLLGTIDSTKSVFSPSDYRKLASEIISDVKSRNRLPLIVGGSNSLIYSLVTNRYDQGLDVFDGADPGPISSELRYNCCFIWVDVGLPVLDRYLSNRVDKMLDDGMFEELVEFFRSGECKKVNRFGLGQAIGVPEFEGYFRKFPVFRRLEGSDSDELEAYDEAVKRIKYNTCQLAKKQRNKILRLRDAGWDLNRIDATAAFRAVMTADSGKGVAEIWETEVVEPSFKIVKSFIDE